MPTIVERLRSAASALFGAGTAERGYEPPAAPTVIERASDTAGITRQGSETTGEAPQQDKWVTVLGPAMTPENIDRIIRNAHRGYMQRYCDLLSEQRAKVTHLQGVLNVRETAVSSRPWMMVPAQTGKKRTDKRAIEISDYVRDRFKAIPFFSDRLKHLAGGIYWGRSGLETEFFRDARGIGIKQLHPIHPRRLSYAAFNWRLHLYDESGNQNNPQLALYPGVDIEESFPDRFVIHEPKTNGAETPTRQGIGYDLVWTLLFWIWTTRDWMQFAELHGRPWKVGTWDKATSGKEDIAALEAAVQRLSGANGVALPKGADLKLLLAGNAGGTHESLRTAFNAEISKVVLGQTGTTELGDKGSYAAVKVHDLVRGDVLASDGTALSETVTRGLVYPLVKKQFGRDAADSLCPQFQIITQADESLDTEFKRVMGLVDRGVAIAADPAREHFTRMPKPEAGAVLIRPLGEMTKVGLGPVTSNEEAQAEKDEQQKPSEATTTPASGESDKPADGGDTNDGADKAA